MAKKILLYLTASRLTAHSLARGRLVVDTQFECDEKGLAAFAAYIAGSRKLYYLLVDVAEEDYHQDSIPALGRGERRQVLARKLGQRYRDTGLALSMSLGYHRGERREEKVLYASFSNTQQLRPWLAALERARCRLAGVYSTALLAPTLIREAGLRVPRCLLVSVQQTGLRQSYVEDGKIRFSRLGQLNLDDSAGVAAACAAESARLQQYLAMARQLPAATTAIDVMVLAAAKYHSALGRTCRGNELLRFHLIDADSRCRAAGLKAFPQQTPCAALYLHALARTAPAQQFAQERHRHQYRLWQFGRALYATGLAGLAAGLVFAGAQLSTAQGVHGRIQSDRTRSAALKAKHARVAAAMPAIPTSAENLRATMQGYALLRAQTVTPAELYIEISKALAPFPQVKIERVQWRAGKSADQGETSGGSAATAAAAVEAGYAQAVVSARVTGARRTAPRSIIDLAARFVAELKRNPRLEVSDVRLPFSATADDTLAGDIGAERPIAEDADFDLSVATRLGG